jgi:hypothetical protein
MRAADLMPTLINPDIFTISPTLLACSYSIAAGKSSFLSNCFTWPITVFSFKEVIIGKREKK